MTVIKLQIINYMRQSPTNGKSMNKGQNQKYGNGKTFWRQCMNNHKKKWVNNQNTYNTFKKGAYIQNIWDAHDLR